MTLAILVFSLRFFTSAPNFEAQATQPAAQSSQSAQSGTQSTAPSTSGSQPTDARPHNQSASRKKATARTHSRKKTARASPCVVNPQTNATGSHPKQESADAAQQPSASGTRATSKDCPPPRIVVRQGGTKDPSIQLAGGDAAQAAQKRDNINQLLGQTDQNLKKAEDMQLTASQQEVVTQARQYVVQSKTAMDNGDFERARTLAWKAQLLSQDLTNPAK